jgi:hypothetical protein
MQDADAAEQAVRGVNYADAVPPSSHHDVIRMSACNAFDYILYGSPATVLVVPLSHIYSIPIHL